MPSWVPTWPQTNMKSWRVTPRSKCQTVVTIKKLSEVDETETGYKWLSSYPPIIYFLYIFLSKQSFRIVMTRTKDKRPGIPHHDGSEKSFVDLISPISKLYSL